jgi:hypothetical protein
MSTHPRQPANFRAVERIADRSGNPLPRPVLKGLFTPEVAQEYVARHHGPYPVTAFRISELVPDRYGIWVAPSYLEPADQEPGPEREAEAGI